MLAISRFCSSASPVSIRRCSPRGMCASSDVMRPAISRATVRMVPSAGSRTERVGALGGPGERGGDQHRVDQLAGTGDQLLGGAAHELAEDDAAVAAGAQQGGAGDGLDDLRAADLVQRHVALVAQARELVDDGAQRERHVVPRVAVGDGEDVEVVDLLAPRLERGERALDDRAEADQAGVQRLRHRASLPAGRSRGLGDLAGLEAAGADVGARLARPSRRSAPSGGSGRTAAWWRPSSGSGCSRRTGPLPQL